MICCLIGRTKRLNNSFLRYNKPFVRFPSFIRLPRNKQFEITPRYYDPVKEEITERTERIKREMKGEHSDYAPGRIKFERKTQAVPSSSFLQMIIAAVLGLSVVGWLFYGNDIFYALWLAVPVYLYFRLKNRFSKDR